MRHDRQRELGGLTVDGQIGLEPVQSRKVGHDVRVHEVADRARETPGIECDGWP